MQLALNACAAHPIVTSPAGMCSVLTAAAAACTLTPSLHLLRGTVVCAGLAAAAAGGGGGGAGRARPHARHPCECICAAAPIGVPLALLCLSCTDGEGGWGGQK
jgi:hypothetical protein